MGPVPPTGWARCPSPARPSLPCAARRYNPCVSRYYGPNDADELVPELAIMIGRLRSQRKDLLVLRDAARALESSPPSGPDADDRGPDRGPDADPGADPDADPELRRIHLRMRGIVDQMQADVAWLDERDIVLRDIATGLLDLPALVAGRPVWLCWRLGEDRVAFWHDTTEGFSRRKPLSALPDGVARA